MLKNFSCMNVIDASREEDAVVTVVSGLPRSGTSMMMRVLAFGGIPPLTDTVRAGDDHNPHGYYEYEPVKNAEPYSAWIDQAAGRAVKLVSRWVARLPASHRYQVIFMHRRMDDVLRSQRDMARHHSGAAWQGSTADQLAEAYRANVAQCLRWMKNRPNVDSLEVDYEQVLAQPHVQVQRIISFLAPRPMDLAAMLEAIDPQLNHGLSEKGDRHV